jgi:SWI/SNF-related matrix-associated actin-dependent regulator of chromatin subfamily B protein 1
MKFYHVDPSTNKVLLADAQIPESVKYQYLPRIRCNDCPVKMYNVGPEQTANGFEVHLKNRLHRERLAARRAQAASATSA